MPRRSFCELRSWNEVPRGASGCRRAAARGDREGSAAVADGSATVDASAAVEASATFDASAAGAEASVDGTAASEGPASSGMKRPVRQCAIVGERMSFRPNVQSPRLKKNASFSEVNFETAWSSRLLLAVLLAVHLRGCSPCCS